MMASEIPAAINPYSIAVAPDSFDQNLTKKCFNLSLQVPVMHAVPKFRGGNLHPNLEGPLNRNPKMPRSFPDIVGRWHEQPEIVNGALFPVKKIVGMFDDNLRAMSAQYHG
jgi:hypothetical protein